MSGTFRVAPAINFGYGISEQTGAFVRSLGVERVLLVTDVGIRAAGISGKIEAALSSSGIAFEIYDQVSPNPRDYECLAAAELARASGAQAIVAIGGGSPIDLAKAAAGLATAAAAVHLGTLAFKRMREKRADTIAAEVESQAGTGSKRGSE